MRIGMFGNQNNYPFLLARALRALGHDVLVLVDGTDPLNRPEGRYRDVPFPYPPWIQRTAPVDLADVVCRTTLWRSIIERLSTCDGVVLNGIGHAAAAELPVPSFCLATGADLDLYANPAMAERYARNQLDRARPRDWLARAWDTRTLDRERLLDVALRVPPPLFRVVRKALFRRFARRQGAGFGRAAGFSYFPPGAVPEGDALIRRWVRPGTPRLLVYLTDLDTLTPVPAPDNRVLRIFNATRFDWAPPSPPMVGAWENKRNDILVRGLALYHTRTGRRLDIRFVAKGQSVPHTQALVHRLGLEPFVTWRPEMTQLEVFEEYAAADIVTEQFGRHAVGMAGFDAMATGRPVLCNGRPEVFGPAFGDALPVAQASTPEGVAGQLEHLSRAAVRHELAARGRQFVERHASPLRAAERIVSLLARAGAGGGRSKEAA